MIIEEADFRMESVGDNLHFWDLSILKTIKSKDGERQEFKVIGYGLPISACLQRIADYRIECKHPDAMSLKEYIQDYKQEAISAFVHAVSDENKRSMSRFVPQGFLNP